MDNVVAEIGRKPKILFFDLEMTGGNVINDDIIQFSLVDLYDGVIFNKYIKPRKCKSWKDTEAIHHIKPHMVKSCGTMDAHKTYLRKILNQADMLIGFGIENDMKFMLKDHLRVGKQTIIYDVQKSYSRIYSGSNNMPSLQHCAKYYGCPSLGNIHNSLTDTYMTAYTFIKIYQLPIPEWLEKVIEENKNKI